MLPPRGRAEQGLAAVSAGLLLLEMWLTSSHVNPSTLPVPASGL